MLKGSTGTSLGTIIRVPKRGKKKRKNKNEGCTEFCTHCKFFEKQEDKMFCHLKNVKKSTDMGCEYICHKEEEKEKKIAKYERAMAKKKKA